MEFITLITMYSDSDPVTSIPIRSSTLKMLQYYKVGRKSWDEVINAFIEEFPPEAFLREMLKRAKHGPFVPAEEAYRTMGIG